jgi:hypothetical protein
MASGRQQNASGGFFFAAQIFAVGYQKIDLRKNTCSQ